MMRRFERILENMGNKLDRLDTKLAKFHKDQYVDVSNVRKQDRLEPRMKNYDAYEVGGDIDEVRGLRNKCYRFERRDMRDRHEQEFREEPRRCSGVDYAMEKKTTFVKCAGSTSNKEVGLDYK